jgi:hypothetical protein
MGIIDIQNAMEWYKSKNIPCSIEQSNGGDELPKLYVHFKHSNYIIYIMVSDEEIKFRSNSYQIKNPKC